MRTGCSKRMRRVSPWFAAAVAALVLFTFGLAASESLHKQFHDGAGNSIHQCAVTFFVHGQVDSVSGHVALPQPHLRSEILSVADSLAEAPID